MKKITTIKELKELAVDGLDCCIMLNGGLRSSKHIRFHQEDNTFYVMNEIDGSEQELTEAQLLDKGYTNIGEAMEKGALLRW